jgi:hypothetical protein
MKKSLFFGLLFVFSLNSVAQKNTDNYKETLLTSNENTDYFLQSSNFVPAIVRNSDGTLRVHVVARGKGSEYGKTGNLAIDVNCKTKQLNTNGKGWAPISQGSVGAGILNKVCNMS